MQKYLSPVIRFLFCVFIILKAPYCFPQSIIDSLEQALTEQPESDKPGTLILLSEEYRKTDVRKSIKTASIALSLARKLELRKEEASALNEIGRSLNRQSDYKKAIEYFEKSLEIRQILLAENPDDHEIKSKISKSLNNIGNAYYSLGDFKNAADYLEKSAAVKKECNDEKGAAITLLGLGNIYNRWGQYKKAVENYQEAQNFFEKTGYDEGLAQCLNSNGIIYQNWGNYEQAKEYYDKALEIQNKRNDKQAVAQLYNNLGSVSSETGDFKKAIEYYHRALENFEIIKDKAGKAQALQNIGLIYAAKKDYNKAQLYYQQSLTLNRETDNKYQIVNILSAIGNCFTEMKSYDKAIRYLKESYELAINTGLSNEIFRNCKSLSEAYRGAKDYVKSFDYIEKYIQLKDSVYNAEKFKQLSELQTKYETEKKKKEIEIKTLKLKESEEVNKRQKAVIYSIIGGLILISFFSILLYRLYLKIRKKNLLLVKQKMEIEIQAKELEKLSIVASETDNSVIIANAEGIIEYVNAGFTKLFEYTFDEFASMRGKNIVKTSFYPDFLDLFLDCIEKKNSVVYTTLSETKSGKKIWVQTTLTPYFDNNGNLQKLIAIDSDVTKIKEAEEEIRFQKKEITDSIHYAKRIQSAILPRNENLKDFIGDYFILFRPRDIVSGDFYWTTSVHISDGVTCDRVSDEMSGNRVSNVVFGSRVTSSHPVTIIAVADCTGHGVPGAFMSMLGISFLNEIVNKEKIVNPAQILNELRKSVIESLKQKGASEEMKIVSSETLTNSSAVVSSYGSGKDTPSSFITAVKTPYAANENDGSSSFATAVKDGMDIALCILDPDKHILQFAGANNPLWIIRHDLQGSVNKDNRQSIANGADQNDPQGHVNKGKSQSIAYSADQYDPTGRENELIEIKGDKMPIAIYDKMPPFVTIEIPVHKGDTFYIFSDGYADQFGGPKGKKLMYKRMKQLLIENRNSSMPDQRLALEKNLTEWMSHLDPHSGKPYEQVDDICVIGLRI